jgi:hypothetical protein
VRSDACYSVELAALDVFMERLRALPCGRNAVIVFIIEANLDWGRADMIAKHTYKYTPVFTMREDPGAAGRAGVWMTNARKNQMNNDANFFMTLHALHMLPAEHKQQTFVTTGTKYTTETRTTAIKLFQSQLTGYRCKIHTPAVDQSQIRKASFTGKSSSSKDDMVIAFQLALTWGMQFLGNPEYMGRFKYPTECIVSRVRPQLNELYN